MNIVKLNTISLDGDTFIKKGGSSNTAPTRKYTGHADVEGLKAIGWDDEDIAYYQQYGVNWNEEEDMYHKVSDANKALYGVLTVDNISTYKDRIVYLPKIPVPTNMRGTFYDCRWLIAIPKLDTSNVTYMEAMFSSCYSLTSIPPLDTSKVTNMGSMFLTCTSLTSIPPLDTSKVTNMEAMFRSCTSLTSILLLDTSKATNMGSMFYDCTSLTSIPPLDTSNVTYMGQMFYNCGSLTSIPPLDTSKVSGMYQTFRGCTSLTSIPLLDTSKATNMDGTFSSCFSSVNIKLKNIRTSISVTYSLLHKDSVLYMINNEAATSPITLTLHSAVYDTLINDEEIIAALEAHPNVSLAK